jgi:hypothetical protein
MKQRGRSSLAALTAPAAVGAVALVRRPDAPVELTPEQTEEWERMVDALPADWFTAETHPLLAQWCRHVVMARRVSQMIETATQGPELNVCEIRDLLAMQTKETAALKALGASMRVSQQASYSARGAAGEKGRSGTMKRPWQGG